VCLCVSEVETNVMVTVDHSAVFNVLITVLFFTSVLVKNKSDIPYLKTSRAFDIQIHSRALLAAIPCWLATL